MRILWISIADLHQAGERLDSHNATARYRMLVPSRELERQGHTVEIFNPRHSMQFATQALAGADAMVFSKLLVDKDESFAMAIRHFRELLRRIAPGGPRLVLDVNDDHFDVPEYREFYAAQRPDAWVAATADMARALGEVTGARVRVIPDPYEGGRGVPAPPLPTRYPTLFRLLDRLATRPSQRWRASLLWFGNAAGLAELQRALPELERVGGRFPLHLHVVSAAGGGIEAACAEQNRRARGTLTMGFERWSTAATWRALRACDIVLLPADLTQQKNRVKSANRLIEAIRAGRFAVAHPLAAYRELADYAWVGESLADGILWALRHPDEVMRRLELGQQAIAERFSPEAVAREWLDILQG